MTEPLKNENVSQPTFIGKKELIKKLKRWGVYDVPHDHPKWRIFTDENLYCGYPEVLRNLQADQITEELISKLNKK